jgi:uncharacterized membrane protein
MTARSLRITLTTLTVAGLGIAGYLTYVHYAEVQPVCTAGDSCIKVQSSVYSELAGVPVALIGLLGYASILGLLLARENENTRFAMMALTLIGFAFSGYLTYRELFSIHAICEWCATSAAILTVMAPLSVWRYLHEEPTLLTPAASHSLQGSPAGSTAPLGALPHSWHGA